MKRLILFVPAILLLAGCSHTNLRMYNAAGLIGAADATGVPVIQEGQRPGRPYRILGQVFAERAMRGDSDQGLADLLGGSAARMGADAVIGAQYNTGSSRHGWRWACGLAVKYLEGGEAMAPPPDYTVAVVAVVDLRGDSTAVDREVSQKVNPAFDTAEVGGRYDPKDEVRGFAEGAQDRATFLWIAEYHLQRLGYYTRIVPDSVTLAQIQAMKPESLRTIGGEDTALLLLLTFGGTSGSNIGVLADQRALLSATLISKETGTSVWENTAEGSRTSWGLIEVLTEGGRTRRGRAIASGAAKIFRTLQPRSEGSVLKWGADLDYRFFAL